MVFGRAALHCWSVLMQEGEEHQAVLHIVVGSTDIVERTHSCHSNNHHTGNLQTLVCCSNGFVA